MSWNARLWLFGVLVVAAVFFPGTLKLSIFLVAALVALLVLYRLQKLPEGLSAFIDKLIYGRGKAPAYASGPVQSSSAPRSPEPDVRAEPQALFRLFQPHQFISAYSSRLFQQSTLGKALSDELYSYFSKANPTKPLSILVVGQSSSGKTRLLHALGDFLREAFSSEVSVVPAVVSVGPTRIDYASVKPRQQSNTVHMLALDNVDRLSTPAQKELDQVLGDRSKAGLVLIATTTLEATWGNTLREDISGQLDPTLVSRFDAVLPLQPLALEEKADVLCQLLQELVEKEYQIRLLEPDDDALLAFSISAALQWEERDFHHAWHALQQGARDALLHARKEDWRTITVTHFDPGNQTITVRPAHTMGASQATAH